MTIQTTVILFMGPAQLQHPNIRQLIDYDYPAVMVKFVNRMGAVLTFCGIPFCIAVEEVAEGAGSLVKEN